MPPDSPFENLKSRESSDFPKTCANCGRHYASEKEYIEKTQKLAHAHSFREVSDETGPFLEVFRNCVCGSTLMSFFETRRDVSEKGDRRRALFDACLNAMIAGGEDADNAKTMLRKLIRNDV